MYKRLNYTERLILERLTEHHMPVRDICRIMERHNSTIYRELKRGAYERLNSDLTTRTAYSATIAQEKAEENASSHGPDLKIADDFDLAAYIEEKILEGWSPDMITGRLRREGSPYHTDICTSTLYSYIHKGVFFLISDKNLARHGERKKQTGSRKASRAPAGTSIEKRPEDVKTRQSFGHWEMDTVIGSKDSRETLLVLTERKTRHELMVKMKDKTAASTVRALNRIRRQFGRDFYRIFKSITVDNGSEFASRIWQSKTSPLHGRVPVYYCHPYSAYERGSNENANILIRRYIPKGDPIENHSQHQIAAYQEQINGLPRKILGYRTAGEAFREELAAAMNG